MLRLRRRLRAVSTVAACMVVTGAATAAPATAQALSPTPFPESITTVVGTGGAGSGGDGGLAVKAHLHTPTGVAQDLTGSLYISDSGNNKIRKVVAPTMLNADIIVTFAGTGTAGFAGDGGMATRAQLDRPTGIAVDTHGDIFIADTGNGRVREVLPNGIIRTIAGDGGSCDSRHPAPLGNGGPARAATLCAPTGVAVGAGGKVYVSDTGHAEVRRINLNGTITDFAGDGIAGSGGNGGDATNARLNQPTGLAIDSTRNVYIADTENMVVREVSPRSIITRFAGNHSPGFSGDGSSATGARLLRPTGVGVDQLGDVYISDTGNQRLRKVNANGIISTFAGNGQAGFSGDGGPATSAKLNTPTGSIAADGAAVYFSDTANQRVRGVFDEPLPILPEAPSLVLLPLSAVLIGGIYLLVRSRRRRSVVA